MRNIMVVDCKSTGINYIGDIVNRRYNPVVLQLKLVKGNEETEKKELETCYSNISDKFDIIHEKDTYEETLEEVRKYDPKVIVAGSEHGVILATKLANDLNILCNPIENMDYFTFKDKMQEKIAEAGLRHIRGKAVRSLEEAIEYYDTESFEDVVIKPVYGAASVGVFICLNKQEMIDAINELSNLTNIYGEKIEEFVVQERIKGDEYYVNTCSCDGVHQVSLIWKYGKVKTAEGGIIYDTIETVNELGIGESEMVEYAYKVTDALGIKYGPVHGEFMIDEKGPVLIEVNCRPAGLSMASEYLDMIFAQHDTDSILDSYLNPERFNEQRKQAYNPPGNGTVKLFIAPEDILAKSVPIINMTSNLNSYYDTTLHNINETELFVKTEDLNTTCGIVFLASNDPNAVNEDVEFLRSVEKNAFELILSEESVETVSINEEKIVDEIRNIIKSVEKYGHGLIMTDQEIDDVNVLQIALENVYRLHGHFDYIIVNLNKNLIDMDNEHTIQLVIDLFSYIKIGGVVFIPKSTYDYLPGGRKGIEAIIKNSGFNIEVPPFGIKNAVIASKN